MTTAAQIRFRTILIALTSLGLLAGCASHDIVSTVARPGKYRLYNCEQLDRRGADLLKRERELDALMQKARQGPGGELAIAIAYQNEYNTTLGDLREVDITAADKNCTLKFRSVSDTVVR
jgi:type IV pilus biogenesis protein CpaD/CtpE